MNTNTPDDFWSKVKRGGPDECWPWTGKATFRKGYGAIVFMGKKRKAHRVAFFLASGAWPDVACHKCDNPPCCNPNHLIDGTHKTNCDDKVSKGRHAFGERNGRAKLTREQVARIRERYQPRVVSRSSLAREYGVSDALIDKILSGKLWAN